MNKLKEGKYIDEDECMVCLEEMEVPIICLYCQKATVCFDCLEDLNKMKRKLQSTRHCLRCMEDNSRDYVTWNRPEKRYKTFKEVEETEFNRKWIAASLLQATISTILVKNGEKIKRKTKRKKIKENNFFKIL